MRSSQPGGVVRPLLLAVCLLASAPALLAAPISTDVVVIVDTSRSMANPSMDQNRTSLLVTQLLADIVPGEFSAIRLLDLSDDRDLLPMEFSDEMVECAEEGGQQCRRVEATADWVQLARENKYGALERSARADPAYKQALDQHLLQASSNSPFYLAFAAAQGVFDEHGAPSREVPRTIVWLSDGKTEGDENDHSLRRSLTELSQNAVRTETIIFGNGDETSARNLGLVPKRVSTPSQIMAAFADAFRRIVNAPYSEDGSISSGSSRFTLKPQMEEVWVVVYGDPTLGDVSLQAPDGRAIPATYASGQLQSAGAYRVAYLPAPAPGEWRIRAQGGGPQAAYAIVQRSSIVPQLIEPRTAVAGVPATVVVGATAGVDGTLIKDTELLAEGVVTVEFEGQRLELRDDGAGADAQANDGLFSTTLTFPRPGTANLDLTLSTAVVRSAATATVDVQGTFEYAGGPVYVDLGTVPLGPTPTCAEAPFAAEQQGELSFEYVLANRQVPAHHVLSGRSAGQPVALSMPFTRQPQAPFQVCLAASERAASSNAQGEHWATLRLAGSDQAQHQVALHVTWAVVGLTWWERWKWVVLGILALLVLAFIVYGYIYPTRLPRTLAITFVQDEEDLDDLQPNPLSARRGTGIGWYRHARAFLHQGFRINGTKRGAIAGIWATPSGTYVRPGSGGQLFRETSDGDWEPVDANGQRFRAEDTYRSGESGPYFRVFARGRT